MDKNKTENINILKYDDHNFNKHTDEGKKLLEKSLQNHKFGRSILVDKDNNIIAGNGIVETAKGLGMDKIKVVETKGDELVVVKRTDVDINTQAGREMALADNATSATDLSWDYDEIMQAQEKWGIDAKLWDVELIKEINEKNKDLSDMIEYEYKIEVTLESEEQQELLYNELTNKGYLCRILTL